MKLQAEKILELAMLQIGCGEMQSFDRLCSIAYHVMQTQCLPGDIAEFGCYEGRTAMFMAALTFKPLHLYDSFQGLPEKQEQDTGSAGWFKPGHLAAKVLDVLAAFRRAHLELPQIHEGWFRDLPPKEFPEQFSFVHVDGDFYSSIVDALAQAYPRMAHGGIILIDDYRFNDLPGATRAVDEFFADKPEKPTQLFGLSGALAHQALVRIGG